MGWNDFIELLPYELLIHTLSFFTIQDDLQLMYSLICDASYSTKISRRTKQALLNRILAFVVIDPSTWVKEFSNGDYWYPDFQELNYLLKCANEQKIHITHSNIYICLHHNFRKYKDNLQTLFSTLSEVYGTVRVINFRLYITDGPENIMRCLEILNVNNSLHIYLSLELVSTNNLKNIRELPINDMAKKLVSSVSQFPIITSAV